MKGWESIGLGKRKTSVARVYIKSGKGSVKVNGLSYNEYFNRETLRMMVEQPILLLDKKEKIDAKVTVKGGGLSSQAGAVRHGLSRALQKLDSSTRSVLKAEKLLTRDAREVERKKYGRHKARKRPQFSKR